MSFSIKIKKKFIYHRYIPIKFPNYCTIPIAAASIILNSKNKIDFDWYMRFFDNAGNIINKNIQLLWARILADEIKKPR